MSAPRLLRPAKSGGGHYGQWGNYAEAGEGEGLINMGRVMATGRLGSSSAGQLARRARRREIIQQRRARQVEEKVKLKAMVGACMREGGEGTVCSMHEKRGGGDCVHGEEVAGLGMHGQARSPNSLPCWWFCP